jgi:prevent-host-death family protein
MERVAASKAREDFADVLNKVAFGRSRIVLHRRGRDLVAVVPMADLERLLEDERDLNDLDAARQKLSDSDRLSQLQ